ncbi:MarR family winged helix-turn-helix transcriptional regulator [Maritalea sp. S77]|uniref:MarR family winged helix-turn-helix transcriptional regulator n=1 Tax=Maritalea sp. S77 TaxID=3415125 RepID=UPI003C7EBEB0
MNEKAILEMERCVLRNTRAASRMMTRNFSRRLGRFEITTEQFSLIASLAGAEHDSVSALADYLAIERSTLSRNLSLLEKKGVVQKRAADKGNGVIYSLTAKGQALFEAMVPHWQAAQDAILDVVSREELDAALNVLKRVAKL